MLTVKGTKKHEVEKNQIFSISINNLMVLYSSSLKNSANCLKAWNAAFGYW